MEFTMIQKEIQLQSRGWIPTFHDISREVMDISWVYQRDPVEIVVRPVEANKPKISQYRT